MSRSAEHHISTRSYQLFAGLLGVSALSYLVVGLIYEEYVQVVGMLVILVLSSIQIKVSIFFSQRTNELISYCYGLFSLSIASMVMPQGAPSGPVFILFCVSAIVFSSKDLYAYIVLGIGLVVFLLVPYIGPEEYTIPANVSVGSSMLIFAFLAMLFIGRERRRSLSASKQLANTRVLMAVKEADLKKNSVNLQRTNRYLQKQAEKLKEQLELSNASTAVLVNQQKDEAHLVQAIHHDLREPLRSIISFSQLIKRQIQAGPENEKALKYLAFTQDAGERMVRMLNDLISYTATNENEMKSVIDLRNIVDEVIANLNNLIHRTDASICVGELPFVLGYNTQLLQMFQNFIANSIKYSRPGVFPKVEIFTNQSTDNGVEVCVRDNGIGIAPEKLDSIFGLFNRAGLGSEKEGSGVGLALCKRIAIAHGANIKVLSIQGEGSTFIIQFPGAKSIDSILLSSSSLEDENKISGNSETKISLKGETY